MRDAPPASPIDQQSVDPLRRLIRFECDLERAQLEYAIQDTAGHTVDKRISMAISRVSKPYGRSQPYLLHLGCEARVLPVYLTNGDLVCRNCADLVHSSSRGRAGDGALRRSYKLHTPLVTTGVFWRACPATEYALANLDYDVAQHLRSRRGARKGLATKYAREVGSRQALCTIYRRAATAQAIAAFRPPI